MIIVLPYACGYAKWSLSFDEFNFVKSAKMPQMAPNRHNCYHLQMASNTTGNDRQARFRRLLAIEYSSQSTNGARLPKWHCLQTTLKAEFKTHLLLSEMWRWFQRRVPKALSDPDQNLNDCDNKGERSSAVRRKGVEEDFYWSD